MRACIKRVVMGMKRRLVRFPGIVNSNAYMVMKMRKSILDLLAETVSSIWVEILNAYVGQVPRRKVETKDNDLGIITLCGT